jgi:hypothetical protein
MDPGKISFSAYPVHKSSGGNHKKGLKPYHCYIPVFGAAGVSGHMRMGRDRKGTGTNLARQNVAILIRLKNPRFSKIYKNIALDYQRLADDQNDGKGVFQQNQYYGLASFPLRPIIRRGGWFTLLPRNATTGPSTGLSPIISAISLVGLLEYLTL